MAVIAVIAVVETIETIPTMAQHSQPQPACGSICAGGGCVGPCGVTGGGNAGPGCGGAGGQGGTGGNTIGGGYPGGLTCGGAAGAGGACGTGGLVPGAGGDGGFTPGAGGGGDVGGFVPGAGPGGGGAKPVVAPVNWPDPSGGSSEPPLAGRSPTKACARAAFTPPALTELAACFAAVPVEAAFSVFAFVEGRGNAVALLSASMCAPLKSRAERNRVGSFLSA